MAEAFWSWDEQWTAFVDAKGDYRATAALTTLSGRLVYAEYDQPNTPPNKTWVCDLSAASPSSSLPDSLFLTPAGKPPITLPYGPSPLTAHSPPVLSGVTSTTWGAGEIDAQAFTPFLFDTGDVSGRANGDISVQNEPSGTQQCDAQTLPLFQNGNYLSVLISGGAVGAPWGSGAPGDPTTWNGPEASSVRGVLYPTLSATLVQMLTGDPHAKSVINGAFQTQPGEAMETLVIRGILSAAAQSGAGQSSTSGSSSSTAVNQSVGATATASQSAIAGATTQAASVGSASGPSATLLANIIASATAAGTTGQPPAGQTAAAGGGARLRRPRERAATPVPAPARVARAKAKAPAGIYRAIALPQTSRAGRLTCPPALTRSVCARVLGPLASAQAALGDAASVSSALVTAIARGRQAAAAANKAAAGLQAAMIAALDGELAGALSRLNGDDAALARAIAKADADPIIARSQVAAADRRLEALLLKRGIPAVVLEALDPQVRHPNATRLLSALRTAIPTRSYLRALHRLSAAGRTAIIDALQRQHVVSGSLAKQLVHLASRHSWDTFDDRAQHASAPVTLLLETMSPRSDTPERGPEPPRG
ncbi:MAG TPA: hypothetical protein VMU66_05515 [Gaiellales bacterium]|nr:hypothetical protein [Gaiellales bacterium]